MASNMLLFGLLLQILCISITSVVGGDNDGETWTYHKYIIVGAGAGGLQLAYLLSHFDDDTAYDYLVLESSNVSGSFFHFYPRHDTLLSINKAYTGRQHHEFNLRHDWNSLLSVKRNKDNKFSYNLNQRDYDTMRFPLLYSKQYYPKREQLAQYLEDYAAFYDLNIAYNVNVTRIRYLADSQTFQIDAIRSSNDANHNDQECVQEMVQYRSKYVFVATGLSKEIVPPIPGIQYRHEFADRVMSYSTMNMDLNHYVDKRVAIFGGKNTAFEIAQFVSTVSAYTHLFPVTYPESAYETHYVGNLRLINMEFFDRYLLKSLDLISEGIGFEVKIFYDEEADAFYLPPRNESVLDELKIPWQIREPYDIIIYATGFNFDCVALFDESLCEQVIVPNTRRKKYPQLDVKYQLQHVPVESDSDFNLYFIGTLMHSIDFQKAAGGFIHGYRYLIKALYHSVVEQSFKHSSIRDIELQHICNMLMRRINTASSFYQMFGVMSDFVVIGKASAVYYYDLLLSQINDLRKNDDANHTDCEYGVIALTFDFHPDFKGHETVIFGKHLNRPRLPQDYRKSDQSNFLHPILTHYDCAVLDAQMDRQLNSLIALKRVLSRYKKSDRHLLSDLHTKWDSPNYHYAWLAQWIQQIVPSETQVGLKYDEQQLLAAYA